VLVSEPIPAAFPQAIEDEDGGRFADIDSVASSSCPSSLVVFAASHLQYLGIMWSLFASESILSFNVLASRYKVTVVPFAGPPHPTPLSPPVPVSSTSPSAAADRTAAAATYIEHPARDIRGTRGRLGLSSEGGGLTFP